MIKFSQEKVLLLHKLITEETGGDPNVRDIALLNSALESAFATFDGQELYPTKQEKGARLGFALISNHAFVDGNKRIGMYVLLTFLELLLGISTGSVLPGFHSCGFGMIGAPLNASSSPVCLADTSNSPRLK